MAMFRRSPRSAPPLRRKQEELARLESELRDKVDNLERMISEAPRVTEEASRWAGEERRTKPNADDSRLHVSVALHDRRYFDEKGRTRRPRSLRKERREGRMIFLILVTGLAAVVIWLMSHLHF
ncbi:MAG: hypothetical protein DMF22_09400 [Verrucomicrobia bacterium]|nr:MAG: hypothetical protein DME81_04330 [Verrucomicrobiota bacterium]PYJ49972.1 MAG: hypothetical protein DME83_10510 [Verrucomicrobiota bacterium]PYJ98508.1 MAG: hypothetical protein DME68_06380 [Verrucomicrobiota bacterium]PYL70415.1 MAG: hypothetical protein DMF22_09400 [Verrucomicrobiota bacterium]